jgi:hypothetical protein
MKRTALASGLLAALVAVSLAGCGSGIDTTYGYGPGTPVAGKSVNGTAVFQTMFEESGHKVDSWWRLSPRLERADAIVWFPQDYGMPSPAAREWLEEWLTEEPERTLIYVGRDFDAGPVYWRTLKTGAPASQLPRINSELQAAQAWFDGQRSGRQPLEVAGWFRFDTASQKVDVRSFHGADGWTDGIDATKVEIELHDRLLPSDDAETLLGTGPDTIVSRQPLGDGTLIVVANGSFLLNLPLVNHEHRKLAGRLVAELGDEPQRVFFLECGSSPEIAHEEEEFHVPSLLAIFSLPTLGVIVMHLAVAGIVFCFMRFHIFGLPRRVPVSGLSDFGEHVAALGFLLSKTPESQFASARVAHYQQTVRRDPKSARTSAPAAPAPAPPVPPSEASGGDAAGTPPLGEAAPS